MRSMVAFACVIVAACGGDGKGASQSGNVTILVEDLRIGNTDGEGAVGFAQIAAIEVDRLGRIYVLEHQAQDIRVFDSEGAHVRTIGRKGRGPGEFRQAVGFAWDPQERLWIVDQENARYTVIDTAGRLLFTRTRRISGWFTWRWQGGIDAAGRIYEWYRPSGDLKGDVLIRYDSMLTVMDTFPLPQHQPNVFKLERENMRSYAAVPFSPVLVWTFDPRGYIWFGITAPYRIYQRSVSGDTIRIFQRKHEPVPVTAVERDSIPDRLAWFVEQGGKIDISRVPNHKPAFERILIDDEGRLWVSIVVADPGNGTIFDVFGADGRYQGRARIASRLASGGPIVIRRSSLYSVTLNGDGVPYVVRARIER